MEGPNQLQIILLASIALLNLLTFILYYIDKKRAVQRKRNRISEKRLILSAFLLGGLGALLSMLVFRHKTKKLKFKLLVPIAGVLTASVIVFILR